MFLEEMEVISLIKIDVLASLRSINCANNLLTEIPEGFEILTIEDMNFAANKIKTLPNLRSVSIK